MLFVETDNMREQGHSCNKVEFEMSLGRYYGKHLVIVGAEDREDVKMWVVIYKLRFRPTK
jgi:hypothetical protein